MPLDAFLTASFLFSDAPFHWTEPRTWPWFIYIWLVFLFVGWLKPSWRWLQIQQAKSWPTTSGHIDSAFIDEPKKFLGLALSSGNSRTYNAALAYSYNLSGDVFHGKYQRSCDSEAEAQEFLRGLEGQTIPVQYNSSRPVRSMLLEENVEALLRNCPPGPDTVDPLKNSIPDWLKPFVGFLALLSLVGLFLSLWVHVGALFGRRVAPEYFFWGLHIGIFVVFLPATFLAQKRVGSTKRKDFWKLVTKGSPDGVRYLLYFFFAYAFVNFFVSFLQMPTGKQVGLSALTWRLFSGHWMVFYFAAFVMLSSARRAFRPSDGGPPE